MDFKSLLNTSLDDQAFDAPKPLPTGQYRGVVQSHEFGKSKTKHTDFAKFKIEIQYPEGDSVDSDQLAAYGEPNGKVVDHTLYFTDKTANMAREFLTNACGVQGNMSLSQAIEETTSRELIIEIIHESVDRPDGTQYVIAKVGKTLAAA